MKVFLKAFLIFTSAVILQSCSAQKAAVSDAGYRIAGGKDAAVVPFELFDNRQLVRVRINGRGPFTFVVDTGGRNLITPEAAEQLELELSDEFKTGGAGEQTVKAWRTRVGKIEAGEIFATDQSFIVLSLSDIKNAIGFKEFDGLLGAELFESLTARIDFERNEFTFTRPEKFEYAGGGDVIPLEFSGSIPQIEGEIDGARGKIAVDTGDRSSLTLYVPFYESEKIREKYPDRTRAVTGWGVGGAIPAEMIRLKKLKIGETSVTDVVTRLPLVKSGAFARTDKIAGIGSGLLRRFNVIFDYRRKRIILEKNKNFRYEEKFENYILDDKNPIRVLL